MQVRADKISTMKYAWGVTKWKSNVIKDMKEENKIVVFQLSALNCWEKPILVTCCTRQGVDDDDVMIKSGVYVWWFMGKLCA